MLGTCIFGYDTTVGIGKIQAQDIIKTFYRNFISEFGSMPS